MYAHMHIHMVKVISLSNKAYNNLKRRKMSGKSFSDVVNDLIDGRKKEPIEDLFGILNQDKNSILSFEKVYKERNKINLRQAKF